MNKEQNFDNPQNQQLNIAGVSVLFLSVGKNKNKEIQKYDFIVTCVKYGDDGKITENKDVFIIVETTFKRKTCMKYAKSKVLKELNKNSGEFIRDRFQYYSIF